MAGVPPAPSAPAAANGVLYQPITHWPGAADASRAYTYVTVPPTATPGVHVVTPPETALSAAAAAAVVGAKKPRPRKPYTATKTREMWSADEHERMLEGLRRFKRDWAKVTEYVGTRSTAQVRSHAQKYFDRVARDKTNDYVPQARPKRKSSSPYPRKMRNETLTLQVPHGALQLQQAPQQPQMAQPIAHTIPIVIPIHPHASQSAVGAPAPSQYLCHPAPGPAIAYAVHPQLQTPVYHAVHGAAVHQQTHLQLSQPSQVHPSYEGAQTHPHSQHVLAHAVVAPPQTPPLSTPAVANSRTPTQGNTTARDKPVSEAVSIQQGVQYATTQVATPQDGVHASLSASQMRVTQVFSPYIGICGAPDSQRATPSFQPTPQMSPISLINSQDYTLHPPVAHSQAHGGTPSQIYGMLSPLTPSVAFAASTTSPSPQIVHGQAQYPVSMRKSHVPRHSHPGGPDPNCAKCSVLKEWGNVVEEMAPSRQAAARLSPPPASKTNSGGMSKDEPSNRLTASSPADRNNHPQPHPALSQQSVTALAARSGVVHHMPRPYDSSRPHHVLMRVPSVSSSLPCPDKSSSGQMNGVSSSTSKPASSPLNVERSEKNSEASKLRTCGNIGRPVFTDNNGGSRGVVKVSEGERKQPLTAAENRARRLQVLKSRRVSAGEKSNTRTENIITRVRSGTQPEREANVRENSADSSTRTVSSRTLSIASICENQGESGRRSSKQHDNARTSSSLQDSVENFTFEPGSSSRKHGLESLGSGKRPRKRSRVSLTGDKDVANKNSALHSAKSIGVGFDKKEKETVSDEGAIDAFSPHERKEIFEAVHSLQILARTPTPERDEAAGKQAKEV